eukprot:TRINITY_DN3058_c0_g1_i2.p1 TRINITY_DN3058_c0_g1~~TRINITY_DN3058_c0_g1_i2.p1  ORF type:complete len:331 (-),score=103.25 TRINITY_DN3058_c0_g1_i2:240-1232(-)
MPEAEKDGKDVLEAKPKKKKRKVEEAEAKTKEEDQATEQMERCLKVCVANLGYWPDKTRIWGHFHKHCKESVENVFLLKDKWTGESRGVAFITLKCRQGVKAALELDGTEFCGNVIRVNLAVDKEKSIDKGKGRGKTNGKGLDGDQDKPSCQDGQSDVGQNKGNGKGKGKSKGFGGGGGWAGGGTWSQAAEGGEEKSANGADAFEWKFCRRPTAERSWSDGKGKGKSKSKGKAQPFALMALGNGQAPDGGIGVMVRSLSFDATEDDLKEVFSKCGDGPTRVKLLVDKNSGQSKGKAFIDFADKTSAEKAMELQGNLLKGRELWIEFSKPA